MTLQDGEVFNLVLCTPPNASHGDQVLGQIVGDDGSGKFVVEVMGSKYFSGMFRVSPSPFSRVPECTRQVWDPQYCLKLL